MSSTSSSMASSRSIFQYAPIRPLLPEHITDSETGNTVPTDICIDAQVFQSIFNDDLKCPICLEAIATTWAVSSCLHRFCSACLQKSLRMPLSGVKVHHECPFCRAKLSSRRAAKPDPDYDLLIKALMDSKTANSLCSPGGISLSSSSRARSVLQQQQQQQQSATLGQKRPIDAIDNISHDSTNDVVDASNGVAQEEGKQQQQQQQQQQQEQEQQQHHHHQDGEKKEKEDEQEPFDIEKYRLAHHMKVKQLQEISARRAAAIGKPTSDGMRKQKMDDIENAVRFVLRPCTQWANAYRGVNALQLPNNACVKEKDWCLKYPYLRTAPEFTIADLKLYLKGRYFLSEDQSECLQVYLIISAPKQVEEQCDEHGDLWKEVVLDSRLTISTVATHIWQQSTPEFVINYRLTCAPGLGGGAAFQSSNHSVPSLRLGGGAGPRMGANAMGMSPRTPAAMARGASTDSL